MFKKDECKRFVSVGHNKRPDDDPLGSKHVTNLIIINE